VYAVASIERPPLFTPALPCTPMNACVDGCREHLEMHVALALAVCSMRNIKTVRTGYSKLFLQDVNTGPKAYSGVRYAARYALPSAISSAVADVRYRPRTHHAQRRARAREREEREVRACSGGPHYFK
jgi:hypothetical protein